MPSFLSRFDPRLHLAAAAGWSVALLSLAFALLAGVMVTVSARSALERNIGNLFASEAARIVDTIDSSLNARVQWVLATAALLDAENRSLPSRAGMRAIGALHAPLPEFEWIELANEDGLVIAATNTQAISRNVSKQPWFHQGLKELYVGDLSPAAATGSHDGRGRFVDMAAPVTGRTGRITGVLAARLGSKWLERVAEDARSAIPNEHAIEIAIVSPDGQILAGNWPEESSGLQAKIAGFQKLLNSLAADNRQGYVLHGGFLTGFSRISQAAGATHLDWWAAIREPASVAFTPAFDSSFRIFLIVAACGLAAAFLAASLTSLLLKRLGRIAETADALRLGKVQHFAAPSGKDEIGRIGRSLAALFEGLKASNDELKTLNRELDQRVEERTQEVRRLAEETKVAAITRERLRLSRDLHDTLAHSMLALLSQIRLTRKIEKSKPELLPTELAEAERAAQEGLNQARAAVGQLRYMAVRDDGLGPALERLVKRLTERVVIEVELSVDERVAGMASQTAETIYRIAEEAVHNIGKHAEAAHASLSVKLIPSAAGTRNRIAMAIEDDGKGFDPTIKKPNHYGLIGLHEQAQLVGGELTIDSMPDKGTRIGFQVTI